MERESKLFASFASTDFHYFKEDYKKVKNLNLKSFQDMLWKGEEIHLKILLFTEDMPVYDIEVSKEGLFSPSSSISEENIELFTLKETLASIGRGDARAKKKAVPDIICPLKEKINLDKESFVALFLKIKIPKKASPSLYSGKISFSSKSLKSPLSLTYNLRVLDLLMPPLEEGDTLIEFWQHPFTIARYYGLLKEEIFTKKHFFYLKDMLKYYKELGGDSLMATILEDPWNHQSYDRDPSLIIWKRDEKGDFSFDYTLFDKWIDFNISLGLLKPKENIGKIKCYSLLPWENLLYYRDYKGDLLSLKLEVGSPLWKDIFSKFLRDFMNHLEKKGLFNLTYLSIDERSLEEISELLSLVLSIKNKKGESFKLSAAINYNLRENYDILDKIDYISLGLSHIEHNSLSLSSLVKRRKNLKLITTLYTCTGDYPNSFSLSEPFESTYTLWYSLYLGMDGFLRWSLDGWVLDPLEDVSYKFWESGDPFLIYPAKKEDKSSTFYSTPRLEKIKEGIQDINKVKYLMKNSMEIKEGLENMLSSLKRPKKGENPYGASTFYSKEEEDLAYLELKRMKEGLKAFSLEYLSIKEK